MRTDGDDLISDRPPLERWIRLNRSSYAEVARQVGCCREVVRRACLPWDHADRNVPRYKTRAKIAELTGGEIQPSSFDPPMSVAA